MAGVDPTFVGSVFNALPLDRMITIPLMAMVQAQVKASKAYVDFLMQVCIKEGKAIAVQFDYDETLLDKEGNITGSQRRTVRVPLMAAVVHPCICIEEGNIDFELTVTQASEEKSATEGSATLEATLGWGPFKVSVHGQVSHKAEQTRKTDTRAKYSIHITAKRQPAPEGLQRIIDHLVDAATRPGSLPEHKEPKPPETLKNEVKDGPPGSPAPFGDD
jgi:hypothetical protein